MSSLPPAQRNSSMCQVTCHKKTALHTGQGPESPRWQPSVLREPGEVTEDPSWELSVMDSQIGTLCPHHKPPLGQRSPVCALPPCCYAVRYWLINALLYKSWSSHCAQTRLTLTSLGQHSTGVPQGCGSLPLFYWHTVQDFYTTRCCQRLEFRPSLAHVAHSSQWSPLTHTFYLLTHSQNFKGAYSCLEMVGQTSFF